VVEEAVIKLLYKPVGLLINWLYGVLAGAIVNRVWTSATRADDARRHRRAAALEVLPDARTRDRDRLRRLRRWENGSVHQIRARRACLAAQDPGGTSPTRS
jgi:hypothetical protein